MVADLKAEDGEVRRDDSPASMTKAGLYAQVSGEGSPLILLHGLFGMGSNLGGIARHLSPQFEVHQLDLPNHGRSAWQSSMSLPLMAQSVEAYMDAQEITACRILGHSLGGKVAMQLALSSPARVSALVAADIAPIGYPRSHDAVLAGLNAVRSARPASRQIARDIMMEYIEEPAVAQFLSLSLYRDDAHLSWRFNLEAIEAHYNSLLEAPRAGEFVGPAFFVYGADSRYWSAEAARAALVFFPQMQSYGIADAGHWLHAEKPAEFNAAVAQFFADHQITAG